MLRVLATVAFCFSCICGRQAFADPLPPTPPPYGLMEASAVVPGLREQALIGHPQSTRLIGVYLLPDEVAPMMSGGPLRMTLVCRAYVIAEGASDDEAEQFFASLVSHAKTEAAGPLNLNDPATKRVMQGYLDATRDKQGQEVQIGGATNLGSIVDAPDAYGTSVVAAMSAQLNGRSVAVPMTGAIVWLRRGRQIVELSALLQFDGQASLQETDKVVLDWAKAVQTAQPTP